MAAQGRLGHDLSTWSTRHSPHRRPLKSRLQKQHVVVIGMRRREIREQLKSLIQTALAQEGVGKSQVGLIDVWSFQQRVTLKLEFLARFHVCAANTLSFRSQSQRSGGGRG